MKEIAKRFNWKATWYVIETLRTNGIDIFHAGSKKLVAREDDINEFIKTRLMTGKYIKSKKWRT